MVAENKASGSDGDFLERWDEVDRIFDAALDLAVDERERYLRDACGDDEKLLHAVRQLLQDAELTNERLIGPAPALLRAAWTHEAETDPGALQAGTTVGRYRITGELGRGA